MMYIYEKIMAWAIFKLFLFKNGTDARNFRLFFCV